MLNCEYCDYFINAGESRCGSGIKSNASCKLSGHVFIEGEMESKSEYPCRDISYQEYLNREEAHEKHNSSRSTRVLHINRGRSSAGKRLPIAG